MGRLLAIGDVHGCYYKLKELLNLVSYNSKEDQLVLLGDYIDRGNKSKITVDLVIQLVNDGAIALKGNHEDMLIKSFDDHYYLSTWLYNGGNQTLKSYGITTINDLPNEHINFIRDLPLWHETEDYIFVHAGLTSGIKHISYAKGHDLMWIRDEWIYSKYKDKTVVFGHTPTFTFTDYNKPWFGENKICIDTGAVFESYGGKLTCLQLPEMNYWQV